MGARISRMKTVKMDITIHVETIGMGTIITHVTMNETVWKETIRMDTVITHVTMNETVWMETIRMYRGSALAIGVSVYTVKCKNVISNLQQ